MFGCTNYTTSKHYTIMAIYGKSHVGHWRNICLPLTSARTRGRGKGREGGEEWDGERAWEGWMEVGKQRERERGCGCEEERERGRKGEDRGDRGERRRAERARERETCVKHVYYSSRPHTSIHVVSFLATSICSVNIPIRVGFTNPLKQPKRPGSGRILTFTEF